jgi:hypothetical protein
LFLFLSLYLSLLKSSSCCRDCAAGAERDDDGG